MKFTRLSKGRRSIPVDNTIIYAHTAPQASSSRVGDLDLAGRSRIDIWLSLQNIVSFDKMLSLPRDLEGNLIMTRVDGWVVVWAV